MKKVRAPRNRTLTCSAADIALYRNALVRITDFVDAEQIEGSIIHHDFLDICGLLPERFVDLLILDPPYNITKNYNGNKFRKRTKSEYREWFTTVIKSVRPMLKDSASIYVCSEWRTSLLVSDILNREFIVRNRITWEREKGRGARHNWKNSSEDIWFCTLSKNYTFNRDAVMTKRRVLASYKDRNGTPKDWMEESNGRFRLTSPSNLWTDITVPFWSMPENTDHPTQKPEKLVAKLILASSRLGDFVFDPFLGSGTTAVVAKKLGRRFGGVEINEEYCCLGMKRLATSRSSIQGYCDGVFWERNSLHEQRKTAKRSQRSRRLFA